MQNVQYIQIHTDTCNTFNTFNTFDTYMMIHAHRYIIHVTYMLCIRIPTHLYTLLGHWHIDFVKSLGLFYMYVCVCIVCMRCDTRKYIPIHTYTYIYIHIHAMTWAGTLMNTDTYWIMLIHTHTYAYIPFAISVGRGFWGAASNARDSYAQHYLPRSARTGLRTGSSSAHCACRAHGPRKGAALPPPTRAAREGAPKR